MKIIRKIKSHIINLVFLFILGLISGCTTVTPPGNHPPCQELSTKLANDLNAYNLFVSSSGSLYDANKKSVKDPNAYLEKIFKNYEKAINIDSRIRMTVFIHGGLNTSNLISKRVEHLWKPMLADCKYPLFISWRSQFLGNYSDHLLFLRHGEYISDGKNFFDTLSSLIKGPLVSPFVLTEDLLRAAARYPASTYHILVDQNVVKRSLIENNSDNSAIDISRKYDGRAIALY